MVLGYLSERTFDPQRGHDPQVGVDPSCHYPSSDNPYGVCSSLELSPNVGHMLGVETTASWSQGKRGN